MQKLRGMTLIELLVTLAIAAILMTLAGPSFVRMIKSNSMSGTVNTFLADVRFARSEAVRRGGRVIMCRSADPEAVVPACAAATATTKGWADGWIVFFDKDGSGDWNAGDTTLRVQSAIKGIDSIQESTAANATKFKFTATGRLQDNASAAKLQFGGSDYATELQRVVCVGLGGRARVAGDGASACGANNI
jgi:type IV fimbrial biogenesis protein FimT